MGAISEAPKIVVGVYLGCEGDVPAVAMLDERQETSPRFTLRHLSRLPSKVTYEGFACGAAELICRQNRSGLDWRLVLGVSGNRSAAPELWPEELWPSIKRVKVGETLMRAAAHDQNVSSSMLVSTLRSHFENGQLGLSSALLKARHHVDCLLESVLGPQVLFSARGTLSTLTRLDDLVIAVGLALWCAEQEAARKTGWRFPQTLPRVLSAGDLL